MYLGKLSLFTILQDNCPHSHILAEVGAHSKEQQVEQSLGGRASEGSPFHEGDSTSYALIGSAGTSRCPTGGHRRCGYRS